MNDPLTAIGTRVPTLQTEQARDDEVKNNAGGFVFEVSDETRIRRFLILGTTGNTYYQGEKEITKENTAVVLHWAANRTVELVDMVTEISLAGRAPKQNPTLFALAAACALGSPEGKKYANAAVPEVCRTLSHLYMYVAYYAQFRGWGRAHRRVVGEWFNGKPVDDLAYQVLKYRNRNGWTAADLLASSHPIDRRKGWFTKVDGVRVYLPSSNPRKNLYDWITKSDKPDYIMNEVPPLVRGFINAQRATEVSEWVGIINNYNLSWEMLPTEALKSKFVWDALITKGMPMTALIRNLPRLTNLGLFDDMHMVNTVIDQITNEDRLRKARVHPVNLLISQLTYASGASVRGSSTWSPNVRIVDALDEAFYKSFGNVLPAGKRTLNALDVSGSMSSHIGDLPISCRAAAAAMSLVTVATEPEVRSVGFTSIDRYNWRSNNTQLTELTISPRQRLDDVIRTIDRQDFGGTDCALPMIWAKANSLEFDTFLVWTDNETWAGEIHPFQALREYREASGIDAKLIVCGMTATDFTIADPKDNGMLDVTGFDSAVPNLIADFSAGRI